MACCTLRDEASSRVGFDFSLGHSRRENSLTIELPEGALKALDIRLGAGDLSLEGVHLEALAVEMDMGSAALKDVSGESLSVQCNLGDFTLEGGEFDTAELTMSLGKSRLLRRGAHRHARTKRHGRCGSFRRARGGDRGEREPRNRAHRFAIAPPAPTHWISLRIWAA